MHGVKLWFINNNKYNRWTRCTIKVVKPRYVLNIVFHVDHLAYALHILSYNTLTIVQ